MSNDHYVPQFYLRNFSPDRSDPERDGLGQRSIHLINIARRKFVPRASIKGECKKANFHGYKLGLEAALSQFEGLAASAIRNVIDSDIPPPLRSDDHEALAQFILIQRSRTLSAAEVADKMADRMFKVAYGTDPRLDGIDLSELEIRSDYPVAIPLNVAAQCAPIAMQLGMHVFVNETREDFITSDNPVAAHNQYCEGVDYMGVLGWDCSGIQIFLPLSPHHLVLLYDSAVYSVGDKHASRTSRISNIKEIDALNELQILTARENIYFANEAMASSLLTRVGQLASRRERKRQITVQSDPVPNGEGTRELIHQFERLLPTRLSLTSIRIRRNARRVAVERRENIVRAPMRSATQQLAGRGSASQLYRARRFYSD